MIYVMSDIHGNYSRYKSIMRQIKLKKKDHLYVLGDCIDRNPDGLKILKELYYRHNATVLLGNHELMMLEALTKTHPYNEYIHRWYKNGGEITHKRLRYYDRDEMLDIIRQLPVNVEISCNGVEYLLVHGGPIGYKQKYEDPTFDSVWKRLDRFARMPEGKTVIFGHTPTCRYQVAYPMEIYYGENRMIGIDCGCAYFDGRLACLRLDDMKEFYSESDWETDDPWIKGELVQRQAELYEKGEAKS